MYKTSKKLQFWGEDIYPYEDLLPKNYGLTKSGKVMRWDNTYKIWVVCEHYRSDDGIMVRIGNPCNFFGLEYSIASCFVPNPNNYGSVGFKDGDCYNTSADNLFWTDKSTSGTFREGVCDGFMCFDWKQNHLDKIRNGKKNVFIFPKNYRFLPKVGMEYPICYSTRCLKQGLDFEKLNQNRDNGKIRFTDCNEYSYDEIPNFIWLANGVETTMNCIGEQSYHTSQGRSFWGDNALKKITDNLMMSMFGEIPENICVMNFDYIKDEV